MIIKICLQLENFHIKMQKYYFHLNLGKYFKRYKDVNEMDWYDEIKD